MAYVFIDIDTQHDFIDASGALSVHGADELCAAFGFLYSLARQHSIPIIATMDCHSHDDPEFAEFDFPAHCVRGTFGWEKVVETLSFDSITIPLNDCELRKLPEQTIIEKVAFSVFTNPNAERVFLIDLPRLLNLPLENIYFVVFGVATDYCVKAAAIGLAEREANVYVVEDAIAAVKVESGVTAIKEMLGAGVKMIRLDDVEKLFS